jgi:TPR repeat protein
MTSEPNRDADELIERARIALESGDVGEAEDLFEKAANLGSSEAMLKRAGIAYRAREHEAAYYWWDRAGDAGELVGWRYAGTHAAQQRDLDRAVGWWEKLAARGDGVSLYRIAIYHLDRKREAEAHTWLLQAAEAGLSDAMETLAYRAELAGDTAEAARWRAAAETAE